MQGSRLSSATLLRPDVLLDGERIVGAALDRRVVGDDEDLAPGDAPDARDQSGRRRLVVVTIPGGQRRELEERRVGIEQLLDALADRELALGPMPFEVLGSAPLPHDLLALAKLAHQPLHPCGVGAKGLSEVVSMWDGMMSMAGIYHPQQSVLNRHAGTARRRACGTSRCRSARRGPSRRRCRHRAAALPPGSIEWAGRAGFAERGS